MRIVATSDTHFPFDRKKIPDGDVFILAGDFMYTGYENEWYPRLASLEALPHKTKILVGGNHDLHLERYAGPAMQELRRAGVTVVGPPSLKHATFELPNGMTVLGLPFVTGLATWAFNNTDDKINDYLNSIGRCDIIVSHCPPAGILSGGRGQDYGIRAYRRYLKMYQPKLWFCGHIHESYGTTEQGGCKFYNVAMCDEEYQQVNEPAVVDV